MIKLMETVVYGQICGQLDKFILTKILWRAELWNNLMMLCSAQAMGRGPVSGLEGQASLQPPDADVPLRGWGPGVSRRPTAGHWSWLGQSSRRGMEEPACIKPCQARGAGGIRALLLALAVLI